MKICTKEILTARMSLFVTATLYASLAISQTTLPPAVFPAGSSQYPLTIPATLKKQGTYGISVVSGVPVQNADTSSADVSSKLRLFEIWPDGSTKELGPAHSPHADIRELGGGRFSHRYSAASNITYILFSSSDATDPRTNGRKYLAVQPATAAGTDTSGSIFDTTANIKKYYLGTADPAHRTIIINNPSSTSYSFNLAFNQNGFLQSSADLKAEIQNKIPDFVGEPIERKIWNFVRKNHIWQLPYTEERWFHHPLLLFNSAGWGLCDDAAASLIHTAALFGISGRVWGLSGHEVPEVFTNGSWHLYDPTDQAYFLRTAAAGNVASVSDLIANHSLVTSPVNFAPWTTYTPRLTVAGDPEVIPPAYYANLYSTDDRVSNWYNLLQVAEAPLIFDLPGKSSVEVGAKAQADAPTIIDDGGVMVSQTAYSSVKVSLPEGANGTLKIFLIPYKIKGNGSVTLRFEDGTVKTVAINATSNWNQMNPFDRDLYIRSISYSAGTGGLSVYYLANKLRSSVKKFNSLVLKPAGATASTVANPLQASFKTTP